MEGLYDMSILDLVEWGKREDFINALIDVLDLEVSLFYSALEGGGYTGGSVPNAIWSLLTAEDRHLAKAYNRIRNENKATSIQ